MTKFRLETSAFRARSTASSRHKGAKSGRTVAKTGSKAPSDPSAMTAPAETSGPEAIDVTVEIKSDQGVVLLRVEVSHDESGQVVSPEQLEQGLATIFSRESLLARTAARFGLPAEDFLASLADSAVDVADPSAGLPEAEHDALRRAGISLEGPPGDPSGAGRVAAGLARARRFRDEALTVAQAATALRVTPGRVRQLVSAGEVVTMSGGAGRTGGDGGYLLPAWQIVDGQLLPGLALVAAASSGLHPLTLAGFMTRPNVDLDVEGRAVAPVEWLVAGGHAEVVAELVAGLRVAA